MKRTVFPVTDEMLSQLKEDFKALNIKASIKRHKQKYACGGIEIFSTKKSGYRFKDEELINIADILVNKYHMETLAINGCKTLSESVGKIEKLRLFYSDYFSFCNPVKDI